MLMPLPIVLLCDVTGTIPWHDSHVPELLFTCLCSGYVSVVDFPALDLPLQVHKSIMQHGIPAEIINEIFKHLILDMLLVHNPSEFPWYVGQVCASWRAVFTSTPWIWRKFSIHFARITDRNLDHAANHLVGLCLQRSRDQPISFSLLCSGKYCPYTTGLKELSARETQCADRMLTDLIAESQRWEVVELEPSFIPPNLLNLFPLPRSVTLQYPTDSELECWEPFLRALSLTRVEIASLTRHEPYDFDWSRLTVLTIRHAVYVADVLRVMRRLRCIEQLQFKVSESSSKADEEQDGTITLPTLKVLSCPRDVLRHIRAPALEEFHLRVQSPNVRSSLLDEGTISFLRTSSGSLTRLILGKSCCTGSDAKRILQEVPNVTKLSLLVDVDLSDINLEEGTPILPKLELLVLDYVIWCWDTRAVETLCATVASRTSKFEWPWKLKELRMIKDRYYRYPDTSRLRLLCEEREVKYLAFGSHMVGTNGVLRWKALIYVIMIHYFA